MPVELSSLSETNPGDIAIILPDSGGRGACLALLCSHIGERRPPLLEEGQHQGVPGAGDRPQSLFYFVTHSQAGLAKLQLKLKSQKILPEKKTFTFREPPSPCPACCQRTPGGTIASQLRGIPPPPVFALCLCLCQQINLYDFRYECVAVQEDGEEATTFVDLSVIFAPIIEQEEAYVRRRDGGREVRDK